MADATALWTRAQTLFEEAIDRPPDERTAWLRHACGDDPALYAEVAALLDGDDHGHDLLDGRVGALFSPAEIDDALAPDATGERVGPWVLGDRVGTGGMGAVYRAEREGDFAQVAALKRIKRGMDSDAVLDRFRAERRILARLEHPGIARLLDGGLGPDGRPYFAMEFVDGEPITAYCDRRRLGIDARVALMADVCEAVAYAHRQLVVHRDLKPSNVLVAEGAGGTHSVKLLDFGIAKVLTDDPDASVLTRTGHRVLTPAAAAPEQVRGEPPTTATDVYALGGLLYTLLCGAPPVDPTGTPAAVERAVLEAIPARPSARVTEAAADARGETATALARRLRGDLDTICRAALRKEPERRYGSAAELLADLRRHLDGLPIEARPATARYRAGLFVRRHRAGVLGTAAAAVALVAVTGFYTARLASERDRAEAEAVKAQEVSAFLADLFTGADPARALGETLTARALLDQGAARIDRELAGQPEVQAQMFGTIGGAYRSLGLLVPAGDALARALALRDSLGTDARATARAQAALAQLRTDQGAYDAADSLLALALATQRDARADADLAASLAVQGALARERGAYEASEGVLLDALALQQSAAPGDRDATASLLSALGQTYRELSRYDEAEARYSDALAMRRRLHGDRHPDVTESLRRLAALHLAERDFSRAAPLIREARATDSVLVGTAHPAFIEDLTLYGDWLSDRSRTEASYAVYDRALDLTVAAFGPDHPRVATTLVAIGEAALRARDMDRAVAFYDRALDLRRRALPPGHIDVADTLNKIGQIAIVQEDFEAAERYVREGIDVLLQSQRSDGLLVQNHRSTLARLLSNLGRHDEAVALTRDVLARRTASLGRDHRTTTRSVFNLAYMLRRQGTPASIAEARTVADEMLALYRRGFAADSREWAYALREYADVLRAAGEEAEARQTYRQALDVFTASLGADHPATESVRERLQTG